MTNLPIRSPSGYSPTVALAFSDTASNAQLVASGAPLPVTTMSSQATVAAPVSGTQATNGLVGPFAAQTGREVWLTLSGTWTGAIQILRSIDGGVNKLGLTIGGQPWGTFNANCNEPISFESCANALYYLQLGLVSGVVSYRFGQ